MALIPIQYSLILKKKKAFWVDIYSWTEKAGSLSVEALEKMMDDPTVQKMVYP